MFFTKLEEAGRQPRSVKPKPAQSARGIRSEGLESPDGGGSAAGHGRHMRTLEMRSTRAGIPTVEGPACRASEATTSQQHGWPAERTSTGRPGSRAVRDGHDRLGDAKPLRRKPERRHAGTHAHDEHSSPPSGGRRRSPALSGVSIEPCAGVFRSPSDDCM